MPNRKPLDKRLRNYALFLEWLKVNNQAILRLAYKKFTKETGLTV